MSSNNQKKIEEKEKIIISTSTGNFKMEILKTELTPEKMAEIGKLILGRESKGLGVKLNIKKREYLEPNLIRDRDITEEETREYSEKIPSMRETIEYIVSKENFRHSLRDMQINFLDAVISPDDNFPNQQKVYRAFYSKLYRAHKKIEKQYHGEWKDETITYIGEPKYKIWWFVPKEEDST